ncbi:amidohydrolase [soil metagenome]
MKTHLVNFRWWESNEPQEMLIENGRVLWRDTVAGVKAEGADKVDLGGKILIPSYIDSHCHILPTGLDLQKLDLSPAISHQDVLGLLRQRHKDQPEGWLLAVQYDQTKYEGGVHIIADQLNTISTDRPILLRHSSGHASVANTAALRLAGVDETTPDPSGGHYGRDAAGRLDGTLFEAAHEHVTHAVPTPTVEEMTDAILRAGEKMADLGIACASDMMTGRFDLHRELEAYRRAADSGCRISMRLYLQWSAVFGARAKPFDLTQDERLKISGIKIFSDGAIGSATAAIYGRYSGETPNGVVLSRRAVDIDHPTREVSGQLMYEPEKLRQMIVTASDAGHQVSVHAIGDYAADLVMDGFQATGDAKRHRLEHAMILSDEQIERLASLGSYLTFQPEFLMKFGHSYRRQLGPERAATLKRTRSVLNAGIPLSFSSDRPIVSGNPRDGIVTAINRPEGFDEHESCSLKEAIRAYTSEGAKVNGDGESMGSLKPGMIADYRVITSLSVL